MALVWTSKSRLDFRSPMYLEFGPEMSISSILILRLLLWSRLPPQKKLPFVYSKQHVGGDPKYDECMPSHFRNMLPIADKMLDDYVFPPRSPQSVNRGDPTPHPKGQVNYSHRAHLAA